MWEYLAVLLIGFWLGVALFLYVSCYWLEEILDLPPRDGPSSASSRHASSGASGAHVQLKRLVARVVEEAAALPALARYAAEPPRSPTIESSTYEDLLATAILNKVIERYQTENGSGGRSSGIHSASASPTPSERSSPRSLNSRHMRDITPPLHEVDVSDWEEGEATEEPLEVPRRVPFPEFGGDIVHQTDNNDRDFDEVSGSDIQAIDGSWEENWLFQKKKIKTIQSVPVPMLVPNSNTEYRVLIGDRDVDDTTDLSDNASDADDDEEYKSDIKRVLDSKHVIGGKSKVEEVMDFEPDSLTMEEETDDFEKIDETEYMEKVIDARNKELNDNDIKVDSVVDKTENGNDSILILGIDSGPLPKAEFNLKEEIHRTMLNGNGNYGKIEEINQATNGAVSKDVLDSLSNKGSTVNTLSHHEREGEYEETVTVPVQRYADSLRRQHFHDAQEVPTRDTDKDEDLIPGSIAYRERKKWLNYVEMPNNPYSPEAIQKRLMAKSTSSLFDMITTKTKDLDDIDKETSKDVVDSKTTEHTDEEIPVKEVKETKPTLNVNSNGGLTNHMNGRRSKSPSPKILKDVLAEEIPQYKRYDRDYYIKEAKASAGARKKNSFSDTSSLSSMNKSTSLDNFDTEFSPGLLIKQFNTIAATQQYKAFAKDQPKQSITITANNNKTEILIEYDDANEQTLFSAKPVYIEDETDKKFEEILQDAYSTNAQLLNVDNEKTNEEPLKSPTNVSVDNSYISTSSLEDSIKIYNVQTGEIVKCSPEDKIPLRYDDAVDIKTADKDSVETIERLSDIDNVRDESVNVEKYANVDKLERISEVEDILSQLPKVKELAKKFTSMDNLNEQCKPPQPVKRRKSKDNILSPEKPANKMYMHSLTARSISKEFREELKLSMATPLTVPGGSKEIPEGEEVIKESSRPGSPLPEPGTIKSKLAFFESLKSKFSK